MARNSMRSPRRIDFHHEALKPIPLKDTAPPPDSITWKLWLASDEIAREALNTDFIQGIKNGHLDPNHYGQYTVQDAVYCHHAQEDYQALENRASAHGHPGLAAFAKARYTGYGTYIVETFKAWHIANVSAINPGEAARTYIDFEHSIATRWQPIYGVIAMIPCDQLWAYLATELGDDADPGNLYSFWITENSGWKGAYRLDNFVDDWLAEHPGVYDWDSALFVFQSCMTCEVNSFRAACGQKLLPMPKRENPPA